MKYVEIIADAGSSDAVSAIAQEAQVQDFRLGVVAEDGMQQMWMLVSDDKLQKVLDTLQKLLSAQPTAHIVVLPVDMSLPKPDEEERKKEDAATAAREALYEGVEKDVRLDLNFAVLVILSSLVAAIGLLTDNVAVVIGAMVIAPLLGPNLALSLGTALGDLSLIRKSVQTLVAGLLLAVAVPAVLGMFWPSDVTSHELELRTVVGIDSAALALASGAAAALSLTTGLSSVLVGVMVAVALLPPAAALGLMLGGWEPCACRRFGSTARRQHRMCQPGQQDCFRYQGHSSAWLGGEGEGQTCEGRIHFGMARDLAFTHSSHLCAPLLTTRP